CAPGGRPTSRCTAASRRRSRSRSARVESRRAGAFPRDAVHGVRCAAMAIATPLRGTATAAAALAEARERTLALVAQLSDHDVETARSELLSPLVWALAHIAAYEDLWLVRPCPGGELLQPELAAMYD